MIYIIFVGYSYQDQMDRLPTTFASMYATTARPKALSGSESDVAACYHCGDACGVEAVFDSGHDFCCQGCHTVFQVLRESGLDDFYVMNDSPGWRQDLTAAMDYSWLDDEATIQKLLLFRQGGTARVIFQIPQIHCASCVWLLEKLYKLHTGVLQSRVNFNRRELSVVFREGELSLRQLVELLDKVGYRPAIRLADIERDGEQTVNRRLIYQLGVAGFAFGNIMLFSFPEYLGLNVARDGMFTAYFGYLNMLLALPVFFYSATDYYRSAWAGLRIGRLNMDVPITLGILALFFQSSWDVLTQTGPGYFDTLAGLLFFMLTGKWFQQKSFDRLRFDRDYKSYFPVCATLEDGRTSSLNQLKPGQRILIRHGELIPADGVLMTGSGNIDYSFVTGESAPVRVPVGEKVFAGGRHAGPQITVELTHSVQQSYLTQLWNEQAFQDAERGTASRIARKMGTCFTWVIVPLALVTLAYWWMHDPSKALYAFTAVLIIACPCAIALSIPYIMGNGVRIMSRVNAYLRNPAVIEDLAAANTIVFDKTGTLTHAERSEVSWQGQELSDIDKGSIAMLASQSLHPLSRNLVQHLGISGQKMEIVDFEETPGVGLRGEIGGDTWRLGRLGLSSPPEGFTGTRVEIEKNGQYLGDFMFRASYREGLEGVMTTLPAGIDLHLVSGDQPIEEEYLGSLMGGVDRLHFRQMPAEKLAFVQDRQRAGRKVVMVGDGLNDAGALRQSDVGVVITESLNNFTPASDLILSSEHFGRLPHLLRLSRRLVMHVYFAYGLALTYNVVGLSFAVQGLLSPLVAAIIMPASSITIMIYAWASSHYEAMRLGFPLLAPDENASPKTPSAI